MALEAREETIETLFDYCSEQGSILDWPSIFILPAWLKAWWECFGEEEEPCLYSFWESGRLVGLAPLRKKGKTARFIGSADVCDYLDFITSPGKEKAFFMALLPVLQNQGIHKLELESQHPASRVFEGVFSASLEDRFPAKFYFAREDLSFEKPLPGTWDDYLASLSKKQRHEVRRKLRRLERETSSYRYRDIDQEEAVEEFIPSFLALFGRNPEKANFLTAQREQFFKRLITLTARKNLARFGLLEIDGEVAAAVLYFDYRGRVYLYNSGYVPEYGHLSAGLLSKVQCLKYSIERGSTVFDFLKGQEVYKSRLGAKAVPVYRVTAELE